MKESCKSLLGTVDDSQNEGTSARTRPVNIDDIMLRRKAKKLKLGDDAVVKVLLVGSNVIKLKGKDGDSPMEVDSSKSGKRSSKHSKVLPLSTNSKDKKHSNETLRKKRRFDGNGHSVKDSRGTLDDSKDKKKSEKEKHHKRSDEKSKRSKSSKSKERNLGRTMIVTGVEKTEPLEPIKPVGSEQKRKQPNYEWGSGNRKSASPSPSPSPSHKQIDHRENEYEGILNRKHDESPSGLGGYSPRKKKLEPTAVSSSERKRSDKKRLKWDHAPAAVETVPTFLPANLQMIGENKVIPLSIQEVVNSLISQPQNVLPLFPPSILPIMNSVSLDSIQLTQSTRPQRSLYFENLPASVSESGLIEWLNNLMISSGVNHVKGTKPCFSCTVHEEKGQAVVELLTPEDAAAALSFNGYSFSGSVVTIRRPKDFVAVATGEVEKLTAPSSSISSVVIDSPHKIFVGGISRFISSKMFIDIASSFGPLKAFRFEKNSGPNARHAFLEYVDQSITHKACAGLNGMKLGGHVITALQAGPNSSSSHVNSGIPALAEPLLEPPTTFLMLINLLSREPINVEEIMEDVRLECGRFGLVKAASLVKKRDVVGEDDDSVRLSAVEHCEDGSVLVEFGRVEAARMAAHSLRGRSFDGRTVSVKYVSRDTYRALVSI